MCLENKNLTSRMIVGYLACNIRKVADRKQLKFVGEFLKPQLKFEIVNN